MSKIVWEDDFYDHHERDEWMAEHEDDLISLGDGAWLQLDAEEDKRSLLTVQLGSDILNGMGIQSLVGGK